MVNLASVLPRGSGGLVGRDRSKVTVVAVFVSLLTTSREP